MSSELASLVVDGEELAMAPGESVLDALLRHGRSMAYSCRAGHCHACLVRGDPAPAEAQVGLKETLAASGHFLACQARPSARLVLHSTASEAALRARVVEHELVAQDILRLRLESERALEYRSGQFVHVEHPGGALRSYSLASVTSEPFLELHVRRVPTGLLSGWLHDELTVGDELALRGPHGACFYVEGRPEQPLLLVGAGTGLAPLWGILRDALARGHRGPIHIVQGARDAGRLYLLEELRALVASRPNAHLHLCALEGAEHGVRQVALDQLALELARELGPARAFLCGSPALVKRMQQGLFLAGLCSADLLADPFLRAPAVAPDAR